MDDFKQELADQLSCYDMPGLEQIKALAKIGIKSQDKELMVSCLDEIHKLANLLDY